MTQVEQRAKANTLLQRLAYSFAALLFAMLIFISECWANESASDRVIQFLTNAHTGVAMSESEWLSKDVRELRNFKGFGGLATLVKQTTSFAKEYKGLKSVVVLDVTEIGETQQVRAEVRFFEDERRKASPSAAEAEDMVWVFRAAKEGKKWMLKF